MYAHPYSSKMYDDTRYRAASRRICRDKYLDIICQFYVVVAFAAAAAAAHNFKFCDCINDSKFHVPTNVWTDTNKNGANDKESVKITIQFGTVSIIWSTYCVSARVCMQCMSALSLALSLACSFVYRVCFSFDIYHVNIELQQSTHCRISMFQTWSLCCMAMHNFRSMSTEAAEKNTDVIFDSSLCNVDEKKFFPLKSLRFQICVSVSPLEVFVQFVR